MAVERRQLRLFAKLTVDRLDDDPEHTESVDVWAEPGTDAWFADPGKVVPDPAVNRLIYLKADGQEQRFTRGSSGVSGGPFQGRASLRELVAGYDGLDALT